MCSPAYYAGIPTLTVLSEGCSGILTSTLFYHFTLLLESTVLAVLVAWGWWRHPGRVNPVEVLEPVGEAIWCHPSFSSASVTD